MDEMTLPLLKIFEKVNIFATIEQRIFLSFFADAVYELYSMYGDSIFVEGKTIKDFRPPRELEDVNIVRMLFYNAIVEDILYDMGQGDEHKQAFLREAELAKNSYWNDDAHYRRMRRMRW